MKEFKTWLLEDFSAQKRSGFTLTEISQAINNLDLKDPRLGIIEMDTSETKVYYKVKEDEDGVYVTAAADEDTVKFDIDNKALFDAMKEILLKNLQDKVSV